MLTKMTTQEYLQKVLVNQTLSQDSEELKNLREKRKEVESLLRNEFSDSTPLIRYGGSKAKGTMIRELYDIDLVCYFTHEDTGPGETLRDIYENTQRALSKEYLVETKASALRLKSLDPNEYGIDFHIDVVPGRFVDDSKSDAYLYRSTGEKSRLKTNLQVHIDHVRNSGCVDEIRLGKLWKVKQGLFIKNFVLELLIIEILEAADANDGLDGNLLTLWETLRDDVADVQIEDPANPSGNDLSELLDDSVRSQLSNAAAGTLTTIEQSGWEAVFGPVDSTDEGSKAGAIRATAGAISSPAKPWSQE